MDIIEKYKNIVENKKTDCISSNQKKKAWVQIANEFNAICPDSSFRDCNTLKKFYENKKKEVRKYVLHEKKHINATGGGPAFNMKKDICFDYILNMVNHKTVAGLENKFSNLTDPPFGDNSSQADNPEENPFADNATGDYPPITLEELEADYQLQDVQLLETEQSEVSNNLYSSTWTNMTPNKLKACPTSVLKKKCATNEKEIFNLNRKTPARRSAASTVRALATSDIASKYDKLLEKRLKIAEMQNIRVHAALYLDDVLLYRSRINEALDALINIKLKELRISEDVCHVPRVRSGARKD
uniref:Regulatory protein zeste n=1 Tax=Dendroctonus ponderosae TaxID=77166 RepID=A0AAR5QKR3_DENPD